METKITQLLILMLLVASIVSAVLELETRWLIPVLLLALLLIVRMLFGVAESSDAVRDSVASLVRASTTATVTTYGSADEFYRAAAASAGDQLALTYLRTVAPTNRQNLAATSYFDAIQEWLAGDEHRSARRVICLRGDQPEGPMNEWIESEYAFARERPNFEIRLLEWPAKTDAINMAIIDRQSVFLLFSGDNDVRLHGMSVRSAPLADYLLEYFAGLWRHGTSPEDRPLPGMGIRS
jgi:hypothetical protein